MILPAIRDPRLITIRRGGSLTDEDHQLLAFWAATCAERALGSFEAERSWQREQLPEQVREQVRELVLEDQRRRNDICWSAFFD